MELFCVLTMNICLENLVGKTDYLVKPIYMIRLFHNLIQVWKSACCGKYTIVIKSFWLLLSLEMEHNKTNQKTSNYDRVSLVIFSLGTVLMAWIGRWHKSHTITPFIPTPFYDEWCEGELWFGNHPCPRIHSNEHTTGSHLSLPQPYCLLALCFGILNIS